MADGEETGASVAQSLAPAFAGWSFGIDVANRAHALVVDLGDDPDTLEFDLSANSILMNEDLLLQAIRVRPSPPAVVIIAKAFEMANFAECFGFSGELDETPFPPSGDRGSGGRDTTGTF